MLPFTTEQFLKVFESYNQAVYPAQWLLLILAVAAIFLTVKPGSYSSRMVAAVLALFWLWTGVAYHFAFFTRINKAAWFFGLLCVAQAFIFLFLGVIRRELEFRAKLNIIGVAGGMLILFALFIYPALGYLFGHVYPRLPTFGTPCPTTIFTFGMLLWVGQKVPLYVLAIPFAWSLVGFTAALSLGMREDAGLFIAGIAGTLMIVWRNRPLPSLQSRARLI